MGDITAKDGRTVLFVSHNMAAVKSLCTKGIVLENGFVAINDAIEKSISFYLSNNKISNQVFFNNAPLKSVIVNQVVNDIKIKVIYKLNEPIDIPNFGFVITNEMGYPIMGGNPVIYKSSFDKENKIYQEGELEVLIKKPRLIDGAYTMSIWFGDSHNNLFEALECINFEIKNMVDLEYVNTKHIGNISPFVEWKF
jgi:lipopolysaccharide transport system ATP-binding protein